MVQGPDNTDMKRKLFGLFKRMPQKDKWDYVACVSFCWRSPRIRLLEPDLCHDIDSTFDYLAHIRPKLGAIPELEAIIKQNDWVWNDYLDNVIAYPGSKRDAHAL